MTFYLIMMPAMFNRSSNHNSHLRLWMETLSIRQYNTLDTHKVHNRVQLSVRIHCIRWVNHMAPKTVISVHSIIIIIIYRPATAIHMTNLKCPLPPMPDRRHHRMERIRLPDFIRVLTIKYLDQTVISIWCQDKFV